MFKIIDKRGKQKQELPTKLPFMTTIDDELYMYYENFPSGVECLCLSNGAKQSQDFHSIAEAVANFNDGEKIVEVELHIIK